MTTGTILDAYEAQHPRRWWQRKRPATALELASADLAQCRREHLHQSGLAEYHRAMVTMLADRDKRLQRDIARLSRGSSQAPAEGQPAPD